MASTGKKVVPPLVSEIDEKPQHAAILNNIEEQQEEQNEDVPLHNNDGRYQEAEVIAAVESL